MGQVAESPLRAVKRKPRTSASLGSIAPIRFLKQRPFDQRFARLRSPIFERLLCRFFIAVATTSNVCCAFETSHSRRKFFWA
jgi:hypothetical protein